MKNFLALIFAIFCGSILIIGFWNFPLNTETGALIWNITWAILAVIAGFRGIFFTTYVIEQDAKIFEKINTCLFQFSKH